jgi:GTP-binding protein
LNFFTLNETLGFVDLPGYGYAKVPLQVRKQWGPMIETYLDTRVSLKLILFLFDVRRMPNEEDKQFLEWVAMRNKAVILVITKVDKVTRNEKNAYTKKILEAFNCENLYYTHYSTTKDLGRKELIGMVIDALRDEQSEGTGSASETSV